MGNKFLISSSAYAADTPTTTSHSSSSIFRFTQTGNREKVKFYLKYTRNVHKKDQDENTLLHIACNYGQYNIVTLLLKYGADVNLQNRFGLTPLHVALLSSHTTIASLLLEIGADPNLRMTHRMFSPLHYYCYQKNLPMISLLLEKGANINIRNESGDTALHGASSICRISLVLYLLEKGAEVNIQNKNGDTPLHQVCREPHYSIAGQLIEKGADVDLPNIWGETPLILVSRYGSSPLLRLILDSGADINHTDNGGHNPLYHALISRRWDNAEVLLQQSIEIDEEVFSLDLPPHLIQELKWKKHLREWFHFLEGSQYLDFKELPSHSSPPLACLSTSPVYPLTQRIVANDDLRRYLAEFLA